MDKRAYIVTDLGPGDGGKGGVIHYLARKVDADVVIKRGGAQGSHGVRTSQGESHNFSQWGCGTFDAIPTYCSKQMVLAPVGLENEAEELQHAGIDNPFVMLSVDPACICATPFHRLSSQIEELLLRDAPRGTIGTGVGRAYRMAKDLGSDWSICAAELTNRDLLWRKLTRQLNYYREKYADVKVEMVLAEDALLLQELLDLLRDDGYVDFTIDLFERVGRKLHLRFLEEVLDKSNTVVVESSHGVLTDAVYGFLPHVSAIRTLPSFTQEMLKIAGFTGQVINLAVHRAYEIRHGAGPMPTYDPDFTQRMLPGSHKMNNRWQGEVRVGALDMNLLRYALNECAGTKFDGLCLTWFDQVLAQSDHSWRFCEHYRNEPVFEESYVHFLMERAEPMISQFPISCDESPEEIFVQVAEILQKFTNVPLAMLSFGPTEQDKVCSSLLG